MALSRPAAGACWELESHEEPAPPTPARKMSPPAARVTLQEVATFYQELHTPTQGQTVIRQLMAQTAGVFCSEVDHRGGCLMLQDTGISLLIPPGNST